MRILWASANFLHPTTKGGQIRTLEMLRQMHRRHEIHFVAFENPREPEGPARAREYCTKAYPIRLDVPPRRSLRFAAQVARNLLASLPLSVTRYESPEMRRVMSRLMADNFDSVVCDFLTPAPNIDDPGRCVLFEHNVETVIWERHAETAPNGVMRSYMRGQARRMFEYEGEVCRSVRHVVAVSSKDAERFREMFGLTAVSTVDTGVDVEAFARPAAPEPMGDLVFTGSMDWLPNIDGVAWFVEEVMPRVWRERPECRLAVVGRTPPARIRELGKDPRVRITGTVPEVTPYLWGSKAAVVPLRIGGGTRLKIFEAMAAGIPVVSTGIGAEGLQVEDGRHILIADEAEKFAALCLRLLDNSEERRAIASAALELVTGRFSWDRVSRDFEAILSRHR
jgi:polysaccharide biosynthesis protein PslH